MTAPSASSAEFSQERTGGPTEEEPEDIALPIWAGELPFETTWGSPVPAADLPEGVGESAAVQAGLRRR